MSASTQPQNSATSDNERIIFAPADKIAKVSFEFFPPKTPAMEQKLWSTIEHLRPLAPCFVSVTYGAGGGTQAQTLETVKRIRNKTDLEPAAHLTCVGASRGEIDDVARAYWDAGIRHIVALRGDPPKTDGRYHPHPDGYAYASDLVAGLKRVANFKVSVAAYPEVHPQADSAAADLDNLKRKLDAGAHQAITQFFFNPDDYLRFLDRARAAGISQPIIPGILPITNFERTVEFAKMCGAKVPDWLAALFNDLNDEPVARGFVAAATAVEQCRYLQTRGVEEFHFYTLNRYELTAAICRMLRTPGLDRVTEAKKNTQDEARL
ncbi:methylenetetrahydrofolate reductase [NAD(P)H] [Denitrobaculum tricleocarpae]|uniref:Methylenetetrahydrofolate reductase n=1 Tax=Denitrobaculum tricleocarpae TaxID=2591009 RepID=A0A545TXK5_9PROT|nr:methylenetetrahydrofolate reductase [NAD(P)H] [Denitrobaculum tricleocarpae]TQV81901.1 methylenetetrahydrofolate reductase [NAD(P)H] [Denitrobaculum tricleocarpae]